MRAGTEITLEKDIIIIIIMAASAELHVLGSNPCGLSCMRGARLRWSHEKDESSNEMPTCLEAIQVVF